MRAVVAMSGGVDSSVAALIMKEKGYEVIGLTIKTWPKEECGTTGEKMCCSIEGIQYARSVAEELDIPFYVIDLSGEFAEIVKKYFIEEYARGRTPNPCIYCNSRIKFGYLVNKARELGAEKIATGHYARTVKKKDTYYLAEAVSKERDQSYFLYNISRDILPFVEFPLGGLNKKDVREIAAEHGFMSAYRQASQDICFASIAGDYRKYLTGLDVKAFAPGDILDISGKVIGRHKGIASYTVGQRKGIGVSMPEPVYVLKIDPEANTITVGGKECAMNNKIRVAGFNWLVPERPLDDRNFLVKIRYNSAKVKAVVRFTGEDEAIVEFDQPQFAPTPGQAAVFYEKDIVAAGAWIEAVI